VLFCLLPGGAEGAKLYHMTQELILKVTGMDCQGCVKAVTRAATGAGTAPLSVDLQSGVMRLPADADIAAISRAIERAGFGVAS
jgi:copper chaperone